MVITFKYTLHQELWNWLADNPKCGKALWPGWDRTDCMAINGCFACEATKYNGYANCNICPLYWNGKYGGECESTGSIYLVWLTYYRDMDDRSKAARAIANMMPFQRKGVKELIVI